MVGPARACRVAPRPERDAVRLFQKRFGPCRRVEHTRRRLRRRAARGMLRARRGLGHGHRSVARFAFRGAPPRSGGRSRRSITSTPTPNRSRFSTQPFDAVVSSDFLEHVSDLDRVVGEAARVLKPSGLFLYETINRTMVSRIVGIYLFERVLKLIPENTHDPRYVYKARRAARSDGSPQAHKSRDARRQPCCESPGRARGVNQARQRRPSSYFE